MEAKTPHRQADDPDFNEMKDMTSADDDYHTFLDFLKTEKWLLTSKSFPQALLFIPTLRL